MSCCGGKGGVSRGRSRRLKPKTAKDMKALMVKEYRAHILMCRPKYYGINYSINPWMDVANGADHQKAIEQWNSLEAKIKELDAKVSCIPPREELPDMVFTANAGLIVKDTFVLSRFFYEERQGEEQWFEEWFSNNGYTILKFDHRFEGAGDALYIGNDLIVGHGFRSSLEAYTDFLEFAHPVKLVDPHFYHLDTCFCPLQDNDYLIWPGAFDEAGLQTIRGLGGKEVTAIESEAKQFACNAVVIGKDVILPSGCPDLMQKLQEAGYTPHDVEMSEFIKSGGACKCLTLALTT